MSRSPGALKLKLPNGEFVDGFGITPDGEVHILCTDNIYRQVHPAVVEAFGRGLMPTGIWMTALMRKQSRDDEFNKMVKQTSIDPTA
jgi:hypothetical protein